MWNRLRGAAAVLILLAGILTACTEGVTVPEQEITDAIIRLDTVMTGLSSPIFLTAPAGDAQRLFVVERGGRIRIIRGGAILPTPFLDIRSLVTAGGEQGLLGMAFHPDYATNGHFFVNYIDSAGDTQISRYTVSADPDAADDLSAEPILYVSQPYGNHNGGMLAFGPDDMLYVGLGDGGSGGDPQNHGQSPSTLLGSMLRIDVDAALPYAIPPDNPFAAHPTYRPETWAYGLRNPWRYSFDRGTGDLYIGDVGQGQVEEVSFQAAGSPGGENYGWRIMEGSQCYNPSSGCARAGLTLPLYEYGHAGACSVTGGYVYRGSASPALTGRYFFGDYCGGWIRSFYRVMGVATQVQDYTDAVGTIPELSSFGEDGVGELYIVSLGGAVYRIVGVEPGP